jgi:hypothetical protein
MPDRTTKPPGPNLQPPHPSSSDDESWKRRPSTETTGEEGHNARLIEEHRREENTPASRGPSPIPKKRD